MSAQTFDVIKLVEYFGGRSNLHAKLVSAGLKVTIRGVDQWLYRGRIPSDVLATMLHMSRLDSEPLDLTLFIKNANQLPRPDTPDPISISSLLD